MNNTGKQDNQNGAWEGLKGLVLQLSRLGKKAVYYARVMGWSVFPLSPGTKIPMPRSHGFRDATTDIEQIIAWWTTTPRANIGVATGKVSEIFVIDLDVYKPGTQETLQALEDEHGSFPVTLTATTARGGRHLYYRFPEDQEVTNRSRFPDGIDVRGTGGYVVAPPSVLSDNGGRYLWAEGKPALADLRDAPAWVFDFVAPRPTRFRSEVSNPSVEWPALLRPIIEGNRHNTLLSLAGLLFRELPADIAYALTHAWSETRFDPPLPKEEVDRLVDWICGEELSKRDMKGQ